MKNLTEKQEQIIAEITSEFLKINTEKASKPVGSLFDIDAIVGQREADIEERYQIHLDNEFFKEYLTEVVKNDMDKLNEDLKPLGLVSYKPKNWHEGTHFVIDTFQQSANGYTSDNSLRLSYRLKSKSVCFKSNIESINQYSKEYEIGSYIYSHIERKWANIEDFAKDSSVIDRIKKLYNQTQK